MKHFRRPWFRVVTTLSHNPMALVAGVLLCFAPTAAHAQSVTFAGGQSALPASGLSSPFGIAVDSAGNVFIADSDNHRVVELPRTATGYGEQTLLQFDPGGLPIGAAVDTAGDVFIAGVLAVELPRTATGYGPQTTLPFSGLSLAFYGVAVDGAGDVFIADTANSRVVELPRKGTGYGPQTTLPFSSLDSPYGIAIDSAGDVFIADHNNNRVVELPKTPTGYDPQVTLPAIDLITPFSVAVDSAGNVFIADTFHSRVVELPRAPTGYGPQTTLPISGLSIASGVTVDSAGDVFVTDINGNDGSGSVLELQTVSVDFGGANVCAPGATTPAPCSQTLTLTYNVNADTTLGEPQVATGGLKHLDFNRTSGSTCIGAVTAGTTCTVNVTFAPLAAGFRHGSVSLPDGSGHGIATVELSGFGIAATTGAPVAQLSTSKLSFGAIDFGTTQTFPLFVANIGGGTLTVAPSISGPSYKIASSTCAAGVTPGNSCTLVVEYAPVSIGPHDDTLTVATNGGSPTVGLFGSVVGLSVLGGVSGGVLRFGPVSPGDTKMLPLTVTNLGLPGTVTVGTTISGPSYSVLTEGNTCLAGIAAGQSCTLPVQLAPKTSGLHDDLLTLTPFPGAGSTTVWLSDNPSATTQPYDAAAQFSGTANPNGVWSYGCTQSPGAALQLYTQPVTSSGLYAWDAVPCEPPGPGSDPVLGYNPTNASIMIGTVTVPAYTVFFHPGPEDQNSVLRFTAPASGNYQVQAVFWGDDSVGPTTTDVHVLHNGLGLYTGEVTGFGRPSSDQSFTTTISVAAGDTIDFAVGYGTDGNYFFDSTGVSAVITPE